MAFAIHALALIAVSVRVWLLSNEGRKPEHASLAVAASLAFLAALALEALYAR